jgi:hypothetical protein
MASKDRIAVDRKAFVQDACFLEIRRPFEGYRVFELFSRHGQFHFKPHGDVYAMLSEIACGDEMLNSIRTTADPLKQLEAL